MDSQIDLGLGDQVVLITGGVRGVGAGIAKVFYSLGARVVTCARHPASDFQEDQKALTFMACDIRSAEQVEEMITNIVDRFGHLDALVNNAGGSPFALAADASPRFHSKIIELNLLAPLLVSQLANKVMQQQENGGAIVNISSVSGGRPSPGTAAYGAAKAGLNSLTSSLAVEWAPKVRLNALAVGMVHTEQSHLHYGDAQGIAAVEKTIPLGKLAEPKDIGYSAAFLASPLASYLTGSTMAVHGGGERPAFLQSLQMMNEN
ncbi:MAG: SDR family oxidoreductase [Mycobacteriaceae bacterium]